MGAVCAVVYLLTIIIFIPFPFYKDIVAATLDGGSDDIFIERRQVVTGRVLHRFPHSKVRAQKSYCFSYVTDFTLFKVSILSFCNLISAISRPSRHWRRSIRHSLAT